eukprot:TRINITY_DN310_c0_g1_i10.p4 TRINITY_DN310_c0_g1~~TRINITY_DN310_c0_g1_i10.p4  ORF type:complete len:177 (-),score=23.45 TRINITY_DN310_c0_g1_i10:895-1425(-)
MHNYRRAGATVQATRVAENSPRLCPPTPGAGLCPARHWPPVTLVAHRRRLHGSRRRLARHGFADDWHDRRLGGGRLHLHVDRRGDAALHVDELLLPNHGAPPEQLQQPDFERVELIQGETPNKRVVVVGQKSRRRASSRPEPPTQSSAGGRLARRRRRRVCRRPTRPPPAPCSGKP